MTTTPHHNFHPTTVVSQSHSERLEKAFSRILYSPRLKLKKRSHFPRGWIAKFLSCSDIFSAQASKTCTPKMGMAVASFSRRILPSGGGMACCDVSRPRMSPPKPSDRLKGVGTIVRPGPQLDRLLVSCERQELGPHKFV